MMKEEVNLAATVQSGKIDIADSAVRDNINTLIDGITDQCFLTPYIALERVSKVLANFHIHLPKYTFMEGDSGLATFPLHQFGEKIGMTNDGQVVTKATTPYTLWFEYQANDGGSYDIFATVADEDDIKELEDELESDSEELDEATVLPETGPRKTPGSNCDTDVDSKDSMPDMIRAIVKKVMQPGIKFADDSESESKKKSLAEDARAAAIAGFRKAHGSDFNPQSRLDRSKLDQMISKSSSDTSKSSAVQSTTSSVPMPRSRPSVTSLSSSLPNPVEMPKAAKPSVTTSPTATAYSPVSKDIKNKTMQGGPKDTKGAPISTLTDYIKTGKPVTVAVDKKSQQFGMTGQINVDSDKGFRFKQHDPKAEGGVVDTTIYTPKGTGIPVKATDTGRAFKGKGDRRVDIPAQADAPDKVTWQQPYSKQKVDIAWNQEPKQEPKKMQVAQVDENDNYQQRVQKLKQAFADRNKETEKKYANNCR